MVWSFIRTPQKDGAISCCDDRTRANVDDTVEILPFSNGQQQPSDASLASILQPPLDRLATTSISRLRRGDRSDSAEVSSAHRCTIGAHSFDRQFADGAGVPDTEIGEKVENPVSK
jgi:hypothetical protein